jgi:hypothetical protein
MRLAIALMCLAFPVFAQGTIITTPNENKPLDDVAEEDVRALNGTGAELRGLDKTSGVVTPVSVVAGETVLVGRLEVTLGECRYPEDNPTGEGYAWLTIRDPNRDTTLFDGWMVASSPALNALDHPRYDVWVIRCTTA